MFHISRAQEVCKKWAAGRGFIPVKRLPTWRRQRDRAILVHFEAAMRASEAAAVALLGLAVNTLDGALAKLAIEAVDRATVGPHHSARVASLLVALLDHRDAEVAAAAYACLEGVLDAGFPTGDAVAQLAARADSTWLQKTNLETGRLDDHNNREPPAEAMRSSFLPPPDLPSQLVALSAVRGEKAMMDRLMDGNHTARFVLHCHWLASPRVDGVEAEQLFRRYSSEVERWGHLFRRTGLHSWAFGSVATLVRILPKLPEQRIAWYDAHLLTGGVGAQARATALHRIACLQRLRGITWLGGSAEFRDWTPKDALRLWRYLGSTDSWTLAGSFAVAPESSGAEATRSYVQRLLRFFPRAEPATELSDLRFVWMGAGPDVARLVARRAACSGATGAATVQGWFHEAVLEKTPQVEVVFELAVELGLSLEDPNQAVTAEQRAAAQRIRDAFLYVNTVQLGRVSFPPNQLRGLLYAAHRLPQWPAPLADFVARQTTHPDAAMRRAAYFALAGEGASQHPVAMLAGEAAFDADANVRDLCLGSPWAR